MRISKLAWMICAMAGVAFVTPAWSQISSVFTYQGQLLAGGEPVEGGALLRFSMYEVESGGSPIAGPVDRNVSCVGGLFQTELDFGLDVFSGPPRWLQIELALPALAGSGFEPLPSRQHLTATPYSLFSQQTRGITVDPETGRVGLNRPLPVQHPLQVGSSGGPGNGAYCSNAGVWVSTSDRGLKTAFENIDVGDVLRKIVKLPLRRWRFTNEPESVRHLGPTAQDFHAAFGLGDSDRHIGMVDADGVSLAGIQALHELVSRQQTEIEQQRRRIEDLTRRLERLEAERSTADSATPAKDVR